LVRKEFEIAKRVKRARLYISGLGWSELLINGQKIGDQVLDPALTAYDKCILYVTHDVGRNLKPGANVVGAMLGNGWFCEPHVLRWGDSPQLLVQMNIEFADGSSMSLMTNDTWKTSSGPIIRNDILGGETYDARLEKAGWDSAGYNDSGWKHAVIKKRPGGSMRSQLMPPIRRHRLVKPINFSNPKPGIYVYDMGQLFAGWARLQVKGPRGTKVTIKYSAYLDKESGLIDKRNYPAPLETDYYILKGDTAGEVYEPRFTFHPVRYLQLEGYPGIPTRRSIEGRIVHSAVDMSGGFVCSNPLFNKIHRNSFWTIKNSLYGVLLDCPRHRLIELDEDRRWNHPEGVK
jgi:alpha-L-rhamnosidase